MSLLFCLKTTELILLPLIFFLLPSFDFVCHVLSPLPQHFNNFRHFLTVLRCFWLVSLVFSCWVTVDSLRGCT